MVFGLRKSSPQPWTLGSYPSGPPMLVTSLPTYSVASPYYSYPPQPAYPMFVPVPVSPPVQTIPVPVPVAVQSPMVQIPPPTTTYTVFQPVSSVPSPVIHAPVAIHPANPSSVYVPPSPQPRHPQHTGDAANALMLVQTPQQAPQSSPSNVTINLHVATPQQQPMQLHAVAQNQYHQNTLYGNPPITTTRPPTPSPDGITRSVQVPPGTHISLNFGSPLPGMPAQLAGNWQ